MNVLFQQTANEWPISYMQHAAAITGWNEDAQLANLLVFPDGTSYAIAKNQVEEGSEDGCFQQLGVLSRSAETQKQQKRQQAEIFR